MKETDIVRKLFNAEGAIERSIIDYFLLNKIPNTLYQVTSSQFNINMDNTHAVLKFEIHVPLSDGIEIMNKMRRNARR